MLQTKHFFRAETDQLAEFILMKNNIHARNPFILHAEVPTALYEEPLNKWNLAESNNTDGGTNNKDKTQKKKKQWVEIHKLLAKHFKNGIWKYNPRLQSREICDFCNVAASSLLKDSRACLLAMFGQCQSNRCFKTHRMATDEEANHIISILDKAIKNLDQICRGQEAGEKK